MEWAGEQKPYDEVVEHAGARVLIDPKAVMYLLGTEMDYVTEKLSSQFVFSNPNQTGACGCGEFVDPPPRRRTSWKRWGTDRLQQPTFQAQPVMAGLSRPSIYRRAPALATTAGSWEQARG